MKCLRILPEICARTLRWPGRSTRNIVPGKTCVTVPSVMICSSFAIARRIYAPAHAAQGWRLQGAAVLVRRSQAIWRSPIVEGNREDYLRHDLAELFQRKRWQVFAKLLTFPPRAGVAKRVDRCKSIAIKHRSNVTRRSVWEWVVCEQAVHFVRALEQSVDQCDEPRIFARRS